MMTFPHTVNILSPVTTTGPGGARVPGEPRPVAMDLEAWVQDLGSDEITAFAARGLEAAHKVYLKQTVNVEEGYLVEYGSSRYVVREVRNEAGLSQVWRLVVGRAT